VGTGYRHQAVKFLRSGMGRPGSSRRWGVESRAHECSCLCGIQAYVWTHNDGNGNDSWVKKPPKNILPPPNTEFRETEPLSAFMVRNVCDGNVSNLEARQRQSQPGDDQRHTGWWHHAGEALQGLSGGLHPLRPCSSHPPSPTHL